MCPLHRIRWEPTQPSPEPDTFSVSVLLFRPSGCSTDSLRWPPSLVWLLSLVPVYQLLSIPQALYSDIPRHRLPVARFRLWFCLRPGLPTVKRLGLSTACPPMGRAEFNNRR